MIHKDALNMDRDAFIKNTLDLTILNRLENTKMNKKNMSNSADKNKKICCPLCKQSYIELPVTPEARRARVLELYREGLSVRVIQTAVGYRSPRSVHRIIQEFKKKYID